MCPACMTTVALVAAGTTSGASVLGLVALKLRRPQAGERRSRQDRREAPAQPTQTRIGQ